MSHTHAGARDVALESDSRGIRTAQVSFVVMLGTVTAQVALLAMTGSAALLADATHNFADALTAIPLWIAFAIGRRAPSARFTYGFRRAEDVAGVFVLLLIALSAALAAWQSIDRLMRPEPISNLGLVAIAGFAGFAGNELVARYRVRVGRLIGSTALVVDGLHARTDALTSLAVVLGAVGMWLGVRQADAIVGLAIAAAVLAVLKDSAVEMFMRLMDAVDPALTEAVERAAHQPGVEEVRGVRARWVGHDVEAEVHVAVDPRLTIREGHEVVESVRDEVRRRVARIGTVLVHVDPAGHPFAR